MVFSNEIPITMTFFTDLIASTVAFSNLADSDKIEVIKDNSIQQTDNWERGTPKHFGSSNKKSEPMLKSQGSKPLYEIDEKSVITKLEEDRDLISVHDNTNNETEFTVTPIQVMTVMIMMRVGAWSVLAPVRVSTCWCQWWSWSASS